MGPSVFGSLTVFEIVSQLEVLALYGDAASLSTAVFMHHHYDALSSVNELHRIDGVLVPSAQ